MPFCDNFDVSFLSNRNLIFKEAEGDYVTYQFGEKGGAHQCKLTLLFKETFVEKETYWTGVRGATARGDLVSELNIGFKAGISCHNLHELNKIVAKKNQTIREIKQKYKWPSTVLKILSLGLFDLVKYKLKSLPTKEYPLRRFPLDLTFSQYLEKFKVHPKPPYADLDSAEKAYIKNGGDLNRYFALDNLSIDNLYKLDQSAYSYDKNLGWHNGQRADDFDLSLLDNPEFTFYPDEYNNATDEFGYKVSKDAEIRYHNLPRLLENLQTWKPTTSIARNKIDDLNKLIDAKNQVISQKQKARGKIIRTYGIASKILSFFTLGRYDLLSQKLYQHPKATPFTKFTLPV